MKRHQVRLCAAAASLVTLGLVPMAAQAEYRCDSPKSSIELRACAIAAQGPDALRRFVYRTSSIYGLYYFDFVRPDV
jgi:hypothetical protein